MVIALMGGTAQAANGNWTGSSSDVWALNANWSATPYPSGAQIATFNGSGNGNTEISLTGLTSIDRIIFDNAACAAYAIGSGGAGAQTLNMNRSGIPSATVLVIMNNNLVNNQLFQANITIGGVNGNYFVLDNNDTDNTLTFAGGISSTTAGTKNLRVNGPGNITISGAVINGTGGGAISLEKWENGTLTLSGANILSTTTYINAGTILCGDNNVLSSGPLTFGWNSSQNGTLDLDGFNQTVSLITFGHSAAGYTQEIKTGTGTLTLTGNFNGDGGNARAYKIISGNLSLGGGTRTVNDNGGPPLTISAVISNGGLSNSDSDLILSGANTYALGTTLTANTLRMGVDSVWTGVFPAGSLTSSAIGTGTLTFNNGTISSDSTAPRTIYNAVAFTGSNNARLGDATRNGTLTFKAPIALSTDRNFYINSPVVFEGGFTGTGTFMKYGAADYTLTSSLGVNIGVGEGKLITSGANIINGKILKLVLGKTAGSTFVLGGDDTVLQIYSYRGGTIDGAGHTLTFTGAPGDSIDCREGPLAISANLNLGGAIRTFDGGDNAIHSGLSNAA